jgi:membrane protease YdiL (CAAX protease family)
VTGESRHHVWYVLGLAAVPFLVRFGLEATGLTGYGWQSLYKVALLGVPLYWRRWVDRQTGWAVLWPVDEQLPGRNTVAIAIGAAAVLAGTAILGVLVVAPSSGLDLDPQALRRGFDEKFTLTPARAIVIVLYLFTFNAALEELHYRAWLDRELSTRLGNAAGITISAALFAAMHLFIFADMPSTTPFVLILIFAALVIAGVAWSLIMRRPGGIHAAWLSHGLTDAGLLTWGLFWLDYL